MASCGSEHACSATKLKYAFPSAEDVVVRYGVLDIFLDFCARAKDLYQLHQSVDTFLDGPSALKKEEIGLHSPRLKSAALILFYVTINIRI